MLNETVKMLEIEIKNDLAIEIKLQDRPPVKEPPNRPKKPPVKEPQDPPQAPPPPAEPPVKEPPNEPEEPPVKEPPPKDPDREPPRKPPNQKLNYKSNNCLPRGSAPNSCTAREPLQGDMSFTAAVTRDSGFAP